MRMLLLCAAGALALSACQRDAAPEGPVETPMDATATDSMSTGGGSTAAPASSAPSSSNSGAMAAGDAGADTAGNAPANDGGMMSGPSEATRDAAKEKAEQTNLHPAG